MSAPTFHNPVVSSFGSSKKKPTPSIRFLRQADPLWSSVKLGNSKVSIGKSGCLLTLYTEALRVLDVDALATPLTVNKKAIAAGAYIGAGLVQSTLSKALGFNLGPLVVDVDAIKRELVTPREHDTLFVIHLDHGGTRAPDHFALGLLVDTDRDLLIVADPATGLPCKLSLSTLSGPAGWGNKTYVIRSVRCLTKSQSAL